ncbi:MAG: hypothetical protein WBF03_09775 [Xanthobacteraceae bacterium]
MLSRLAFVAALASAATVAMASDTTIGGVSMKLPVPTGFCELSASNPADNHMITTIGGLVAKSGNKMLNMSADCQQLADWRAHKRNFLDDYGQYQTPAGQIDQLVAAPETMIKETCETLRKQGSQIVAQQAPDLKARIEETLKKVKMNEVSFIGVLAEDANACYAGQLQKLQTETGTEKTQIVLIAAAVVKNKNIFVYRMTVYKGPDTATNLLATFKSTIAALYAANK